ncbi:acyl-CoA dehydrogenase family protein [Advenella mimigardefordensis]|uniref:Dibenzothiophene monooxygenase n=1 Tax=Advenella mimigardefordensis (strain DSM 17166 / LMG 22922 / DPN7) TaxID=1247726 RepID=W0PKN2_ADVMD|nr:acyl-CoA dehydrogenase family protein [Advenella mimigardefordensis]AHG65553.1 putative acyl-CoA dehydrogenase [Advenella mimigardefordensis DPN7]
MNAIESITYEQDRSASISNEHLSLVSSTLPALLAELAENAAQRDRDRTLPYDEIRRLTSLGFAAARVPAEYGGNDIDILEQAKLFIQLAQADPNIAQALQPHACGLEKIRIYGTPTQRAHYFSLVLQGAIITNASAERGSAIVGDIKVRLSRDDDAWTLNGDKHYCTGSLYASHFYILALRDDGQRSIALVPRDRPGVEVLDDWNGMGQRTTASGTVRLRQVSVAENELLLLPAAGTVRTYEGAYAQLLHAAIDCGIALAAFADATEYGRNRARPVPEAGVSRSSDDPYVQQAVGEMAALAHGAQAMVERAAAVLQAVVPDALSHRADETRLSNASIAVAEAKMAATHASLRVSEMLYQVGGASATTRIWNFDRHWRNARTHTTHDPVAYKAKAVGNYYLNGTLPPINTKI